MHIDINALAEEVSILLRKEQQQPKHSRRLFKEITIALYRTKCIRSESWKEVNIAIGKLLGTRRKSKKDPLTRVDETKRIERLILIPHSDNHVVIVIDAKWKLHLTRGASGRIVTQVLKGNIPCKAKELDRALVARAKACARQHFKGVSSMPLNF